MFRAYTQKDVEEAKEWALKHPEEQPKIVYHPIVQHYQLLFKNWKILPDQEEEVI